MGNRDSLRHAMVIAGGLGTRLRPYTWTIPKPLMPLGEETILDIMLAQLRDAGFKRVTLSISQQVTLIRAYVEDGRRWNICVDCLVEDEPRGTLGPLQLLTDFSQAILVVNADVLTDMDLREFYDSHESSRYAVSIAATERELVSQYGVLELNGVGELRSFVEKPRVSQLVNMGVYVVNSSLRHLIPAKGRFDADQFLLCLLERHIPVRVVRHSGYWRDIGNPRDYELAQLERKNAQPSSTSRRGADS